MSRQEMIERGSIVTTSFSPQPGLGRYQGNGRFGGVFSRLGLQAHPREKAAWDAHGHTQFSHLKHWGRFAFYSANVQAGTTADYLLPLARIYWESEPVDVQNYSQRQSFYDGMLTTEFACAGAEKVEVTTWFDPVQRNLAAIRLEVRGEISPIILGTDALFNPYQYAYPGDVTQKISALCEQGQWVLEISCPEATPPVISRLYVRSEARMEICAEGLRIFPPQGGSTIYLSYGGRVEEDAAASRERTRQHWHGLWENSAWFDFPEERVQQMWVRSLAYILSTFNDDGLGFPSTNGFTGNLFPFNFAQDLFYVQPVLLASGHVGVAKSWIERFRAMLPAMQDYARRLWPDVEGIYPPWELPYGSVEGYHQPSVPIFFCYEPHNASYLARMAHETAQMLDDAAWTQENAVPLIREVALYFRSFCRKENDRRWHLDLQPCIGQDEAGGRNQRDYLCALYGAKYSFQKAIEHGLDADGRYTQILADGLAFESLLSERGFYYASAGSGPQDFGGQKHPVQLNGLAYLPVDAAPTQPERIAHALRYATTKRANDPFFFGWTLGEFLLASSRLGDAAGWQKDWGNVRASNYTDADWVQIYETSGTTFQSFYITTHGLLAQSLAANVISDYWGTLQIDPCPVDPEPVAFGNFHSLLGVVVSGDAESITLTAWKDCTLTLGTAQLILKKRETFRRAR